MSRFPQLDSVPLAVKRARLRLEAEKELEKRKDRLKRADVRRRVKAGRERDAEWLRREPTPGTIARWQKQEEEARYRYNHADAIVAERRSLWLQGMRDQAVRVEDKVEALREQARARNIKGGAAALNFARRAKVKAVAVERRLEWNNAALAIATFGQMAHRRCVEQLREFERAAAKQKALAAARKEAQDLKAHTAADLPSESDLADAGLSGSGGPIIALEVRQRGHALRKLRDASSKGRMGSRASWIGNIPELKTRLKPKPQGQKAFQLPPLGRQPAV